MTNDNSQTQSKSPKKPTSPSKQANKQEAAKQGAGEGEENQGAPEEKKSAYYADVALVRYRNDN